jgi:hypothetical protein
MIENLIAFYRGAHQDDPPPTMDALRDWVRVFYSQPSNPPSHAVRDALGEDLDPSRSPLGTWDYDPVKGEITLPPWCNVTKLYLRTEEVMNMPPIRKQAD